MNLWYLTFKTSRKTQGFFCYWRFLWFLLFFSVTSTTLFFIIIWVLFSEQLNWIFINFHFRNTGSLKKWMGTRYLSVQFSIVFYLTEVPNSKSRNGSIFLPWVKMSQLFHEKAGERVAFGSLALAITWDWYPRRAVFSVSWRGGMPASYSHTAEFSS